MYYSITGIATIKEKFVVMQVGGIGYCVYASNTTLGKIKNNEEVTLYTYLNVKEDLMQLFGFYSEEELSTFKMLISVSGVGPKVGLSVLSALTPSEFAISVVTQDSSTITRANGVGKKLAEKIIVELKDKLKSVDLTELTQNNDKVYNMQNDNISEAINALIVLGYSSLDARRAVTRVAAQNTELEDIIKASLKVLSK